MSIFKAYSVKIDNNHEVQYCLRDGILLAELYTKSIPEPMELDVSRQQAMQVLERMGYTKPLVQRSGCVDGNNRDTEYGYWKVLEA